MTSSRSFSWLLASDFPFLNPNLTSLDDRALAGQRDQTQYFVNAYRFPAYKKFEPSKDVVAYARRFIRFKASTDPHQSSPD